MLESCIFLNVLAGWLERNSHFGRKELGLGFRVCVVRRYVDEAVDVVLGDGFGYALGAFDVYVVESKVPSKTGKLSDFVPPTLVF